MLRQFNSLKHSNFTLSDFCTNYEINQLKDYLSSDGTPREWVALTIWGESGPIEDQHRRDSSFPITIFEGKVMVDDINRSGGRAYRTSGLASDRDHTNFVLDNDHF